MGARYALVLMALMQAVSLLDRQILAILAPAIKADLKVGDAEMGLLMGTVFAVFYALFSLPLGRLSDGWTRTRLLAISLVLWSGATARGGFASSFALRVVARLGVGVGEAASQPAGTSLIYDYWPKERRGFVMAVLASAISLGIGGSLILGGLAADWWATNHPNSEVSGSGCSVWTSCTSRNEPSRILPERWIRSLPDKEARFAPRFFSPGLQAFPVYFFSPARPSNRPPSVPQ